MSFSHGNGRYKVFETEVNKLYNDRYRIEVRCNIENRDQDWFYNNVEGLFKDFGDLYDSELNYDGTTGGWTPQDGETYPNMRLVETSFEYPRRSDRPILVFIYETLTSSWVANKDEGIDYELNGLQRVSRTFVALPDTSYVKVVGTDTITVGGDTLTLGAFKIEKTDAMWSLTETWLESGRISTSIDLVGSQKAKVIESFGEIPATPGGYSLAKTDVSNVGGIPTNRYTFLKPSILSLSTPLVGGQQRVEVLAFNLTSAKVDTAVSEVTVNHKLIDESVSDYEGVKTSQYTFEVDDFEVLSESEDGLNLLARTQLATANFNRGTVGTDTYSSLTLTGEEIDNGGAIKLRKSKWSEAGILNQSTRELNGALTQITIQHVGPLPDDFVAPGVKTGESIGNYKGFQTTDSTYASGSGVITTQSQTRHNGALTITSYRSINSEPPSSGATISSSTSYEAGHTVYDRTSAVGSGEISRTTRRHNKGKLVVTTATSLGSAPSVSGTEISRSSRAEDGYVVHTVIGAAGSGQVSVTLSAAPTSIAGAWQKTVRSFGTALQGGGPLIGSSNIERDGYTEYVRTTLEGSIIGLKQQYTDVIEVTTPGIVELKQISTTVGDITGTIAVPDVTPPRKKKIDVNVKVEITTDPPTSEGTKAFDLGEISCSVIQRSATYDTRGLDTFKTKSGNITYQEERRSASIGAGISTYPGCHLSNISAEGEFEYTAAWKPQDPDSNLLILDPIKSHSNTYLDGTGATSPAGFTETGIVRRRSRPILTTLNGRTYYEVITWTA